MKIKTSFISNSSSMSFIVRKAYLSEEEIQLIFDVGEYNSWVIQHRGDYLIGYVSMDNFDMRNFIDRKIKTWPAFAWIDNPGWAWRQLLFGDGFMLSGNDPSAEGLIKFKDDPENTPDKKLRQELITWDRTIKEDED